MTLILEYADGRKYQVSDVDDFGLTSSHFVIVSKSALEKEAPGKNVAGFPLEGLTYRIDGQAKVFQLGGAK